MSNQFEPLDPDEVVVLNEQYCKILIGQPTFRSRELSQQAIQILRVHDPLANNCWSRHQQPWVTEGVKAKVLKYGARDWQEGKVRMRIVVEFCPDEPEVEEIAVPNEPESPSEPDSPLDEIRRMIDEPNS
jgi:2-iminoacetate synthase ThiH